MDLKGIILSEINQRKAKTVLFHLYVESKQTNQTKHIEKKIRYMVGRGRGQDREN